MASKDVAKTAKTLPTPHFTFMWVAVVPVSHSPRLLTAHSSSISIQPDGAAACFRKNYFVRLRPKYVALKAHDEGVKQL